MAKKPVRKQVKRAIKPITNPNQAYAQYALTLQVIVGGLITALNYCAHNVQTGAGCPSYNANPMAALLQTDQQMLVTLYNQMKADPTLQALPTQLNYLTGVVLNDIETLLEALVGQTFPSAFIMKQLELDLKNFIKMLEMVAVYYKAAA